MSDTKHCSVTVWEGRGWSHQCCRNGKYEEGGKLYCKQHLPSQVAKKQKAWNDDFDRKMVADKLKWKKKAARYSISETAINYFKQKATFEDLEKVVLEFELLTHNQP